MTVIGHTNLSRHLRLPPFPRLLAGAIFLSVVLLLGSSGILWSSWSANTAATRDITRSYGTLVVLKDLRAAIASVTEAGERGLLFGSGDTPKEPFAVRRVGVRNQLEELERLCGDDPAELERLVVLDRRVESRLAEVARVLQLEKEGRHEVAIATMQGVLRTTEMRQIGELIQELEQAETQSLATRQDTLARVKRSEIRIALGIFAVWGLYVGFAALLVRRVLALRRVVTVCAWSKQIKVDGRWVTLEQYLNEELNLPTTHGISPEMARKWLADLETPEGQSRHPGLEPSGAFAPGAAPAQS